MDTALRLLVVDDSEDDVILMLRALRREGYSPDYERVYTLDSVRSALDKHEWDLIITDHNMPGITSADVLALIKEMKVKAPVIIVSGQIPEDKAVAAMKAGAQDYVMKDNLARLIPAIERELDEARTRAAKARAENALYYMAHYDPLTNLINRSELERRLQRALNLGRDLGQKHVFLYLDLDQFKIINDTSGHIAGDEMIKQLSAQLKKHIRETDTLARIGGDEFGVLLENCPCSHAQEIARSLLKVISEYRFNWQGDFHRVSASLGFVEIDGVQISTVEEILSAADVACYIAKDQGGNRTKIYHKHDMELSKRYGEMQWVSKINQALEQNQFSLYQQAIIPLIDTEPKSMCYEFLLRLHDRNDNEVVMLPSAFIPAAEKYHLMPGVDRWVVDNAFSYLSGLLAHRINDELGMFFINISGATLSDESFYKYVREKLQEYKLPPQMICFEVTETAAIQHLGEAVNFINHIRSEGCRFALDDFGTGLSSFTYLKTLPVDYVKIDGAFVTHMLEQPMDCAIVEAINHIGHIAGMQTIAEFVESKAVIDQLRDIGVDYVQGYGLDIPHPIEKSHLQMYVM